MKSKKILMIFTLCFMITVLSSCWGKKELNEIALISGMAVDPSEKGYLLSIQVMVPKEIAGEKTSASATVKLFSEEGTSLFQAVRKLTEDMPRKGYYTHLMAIIINENLSEHKILETLDFLLRDPEIRPDVPIFIAKDTLAKDILKELTHIEVIPANKLKRSERNIETNWLGIRDVTFFDFVNSIASDGVNPAIRGISISGDKTEGNKSENVQEIEPAYTTSLTNYAVFKKSKLVGWLNDEESRGYAHLIGEIKSTILTIPCDEENKYNLEVTAFKNKIDYKYKENRPVIKITHKLLTNVGEIGCPLESSSKENIKKLENLFRDYIIANSRMTLNKLQNDFQTDIVGFGEIIHRKDPKLWKKLKNDWDSHFVNLEVEIDATVEINKPGLVRNRTIKKILE